MSANNNHTLTKDVEPIKDVETIYVSEHRIACDGGGGGLGHPKVWYSLEDGKAKCGYCDREFIFDPAKAEK